MAAPLRLPGLLAVAFAIAAGWLARDASPPDRTTHDVYGDRLPPGAIARLGTLRLRSPQDIDRVALSPDAGLLVSLRGDHALDVWDGRTGVLLRTVLTVEYQREPEFRGDDFRLTVSEEVAAMAFATDPRTLNVLTRNGVVRSCDLGTGRWSDPLARTTLPLPKRFEVRDSHGFASPDGTHFAYFLGRGWEQDKPRDFEVLAVGRDKPVLTIRGSPVGVNYHFATSNKLVAYKQEGAAIRATWDVGSGEPPATFVGPDLQLLNAALAPDGASLAAAFTSKKDRIRMDDLYTLVVWDVATGAERFRVPEWKGLFAGYTRDGAKFVSVTWHDVFLADAATGKPIGQLKVNDIGGFSGMAFGADGRHFVTGGGRDHSAIVWDLDTLRPALDIDAPRGPVDTIAFAPDGNTVFTSTTEEGVGRLWDAETGRLKRTLPAAKGHPQTACFTPDGRYLITGHGFGFISGNNPGFPARLWRVSDGRLIREFRGHTDGVVQVALSADGRQLATRDRGSKPKVRLWDVSSGEKSKEIDGVERGPLAFIGDQLLDFGVPNRDRYEIVDLLTREAVAGWPQDRRSAPRAVSGDRRFFVTHDGVLDRGDCLFVRRVTTGETVHAAPLATTNRSSPVAISHDGSAVAVVAAHGYGSEDAVHLFDVASGREVRIIRGHRGRVTALAFSADGTRLATGGVDTTVLIWDLTTP